MLLRSLKLPVLALVAATAFAPVLQAQEEPSAATVVATVNGTDITLGHMLVLRSGLPAQYTNIPPQRLFDGILNQLVQQELLAQSLEGAPSPQAQLMLDNENRAIIASEMISGIVDAAITDDALQAAYDEQFMKADPTTEYSAAHILVQTEDEAKDLIKKLDDGAEFSALAREFSTGPSGPGGGELGWFGEGVMVAPFFDAVAALTPGDVSSPVKTQFGWHLILLKETRSKERPPLDAVRAELEDTLKAVALEDEIDRLEKLATVERADTSGIDPIILNDPSLLEQ